jgi:hypothetical protein
MVGSRGLHAEAHADNINQGISRAPCPALETVHSQGSEREYDSDGHEESLQAIVLAHSRRYFRTSESRDDGIANAKQ